MVLADVHFLLIIVPATFVKSAFFMELVFCLCEEPAGAGHSGSHL
jgi:hypothetical protein